ncbi:hypothetical protein CPC08DRAFT_767813 [Agrocybe pediades]|nr:hypothetical protein CPC08DRAFT_767813 [Agrocybe pediades]
MSLCQGPKKHFASFINCFELVELVAKHVSLHTLISISQTCTAFKHTVYRLLRSRLHYHLYKFVDDSLVNDVFDLLQLTRGGIVGGLVRIMVSIHDPLYRRVHPTRLDIIVPSGGEPSNRMRWNNLMARCGYRQEGVAFHHRFDYPCCSSVTTYTNGTRHRSICIIESRNEWAITPLLYFGHTSNAYLLTTTRIYVMYPAMHALEKNLCINRYDANDVILPFNYCLRTIFSTRTWVQRPCGDICASAWRSVKNLKGFAVLRWGGIDGFFDTGCEGGDPSPSDGFEDLTLRRLLYASFFSAFTIMLGDDYYDIKNRSGYMGHEDFVLDTSWVEEYSEDEVRLFSGSCHRQLVCCFVADIVDNVDPSKLSVDGATEIDNSNVQTSFRTISFREPVHPQYSADFKHVLNNLSLLSYGVRTDSLQAEDPIYAGGLVTIKVPLMAKRNTRKYEFNDAIRRRHEEEVKFFEENSVYGQAIRDVLDTHMIHQVPVQNLEGDVLPLCMWKGVLPGRTAEVQFTLTHNNGHPFFNATIKKILYW